MYGALSRPSEFNTNKLYPFFLVCISTHYTVAWSNWHSELITYIKQEFNVYSNYFINYVSYQKSNVHFGFIFRQSLPSPFQRLLLVSGVSTQHYIEYKIYFLLTLIDLARDRTQDHLAIFFPSRWTETILTSFYLRQF